MQKNSLFFVYKAGFAQGSLSLHINQPSLICVTESRTEIPKEGQRNEMTNKLEKMQGHFLFSFSEIPCFMSQR